MPEINVEIKGEDINKVLAEAVINSTMGAILKEQIKKQVENIKYSWESPIKVQIEQLLKAEVMRLIREHYQAEIAKAVFEYMEANKGAIISRAVEQFASRLVGI